MCESLKTPESSDVFRELDTQFIQPRLSSLVSSQDRHHTLSTLEVLRSCHHNQTLYTIARLSSVYDVTNLRDWRSQYNLERLEADLLIDVWHQVERIHSSGKESVTMIVDFPLRSLQARNNALNAVREKTCNIAACTNH